MPRGKRTTLAQKLVEHDPEEVRQRCRAAQTESRKRVIAAVRANALERPRHNAPHAERLAYYVQARDRAERSGTLEHCITANRNLLDCIEAQRVRLRAMRGDHRDERRARGLTADLASRIADRSAETVNLGAQSRRVLKRLEQLFAIRNRGR